MAKKRKVLKTEQFNVLTSFDSNDYDDIEGWYYKEHNGHLKACAEKIIKCFEEVSQQLDPHEAWELFGAFLQICRPKKKRGPKGPHDPNFDAGLLAAYDSAPKGKKLSTIKHFSKKQKNLKPEAALQHLKVLRRRRKQIADFFNQSIDRNKKSAD